MSVDVRGKIFLELPLLQTQPRDFIVTAYNYMKGGLH